MFVSSVTAAKTNLSALLEKVAKGTEIVIGRAGRPVAVLVPYTKPAAIRKPGVLKGKIRIAQDFDELPPGFAEAFCVEERA